MRRKGFTCPVCEKRMRVVRTTPGVGFVRRRQRCPDCGLEFKTREFREGTHAENPSLMRSLATGIADLARGMNCVGGLAEALGYHQGKQEVRHD